jgi:DNA-binding MarR family transcriptional regulator
MSTSDRQAHVREMGEAMRVFMARAILFQEAVARSAGLNATDLQCANLLRLYGPATPGELAERAGLTAGGGITAVIDRLERAGLVHRSRDTTDRRRVVVTADAEALWRRVGAIYARIGQRWEAYLEQLDDDQLTLAIELFTRAGELNHDETVRLRSQARPQRSEEVAG